MHLCELAMKGEPLLPVLPLSLVPPSLRKFVAASAPPGSGTPGSVHSGTNEEVRNVV